MFALAFDAAAHIPAKWSPVRRQGYAPNKDSTWTTTRALAAEGRSMLYVARAMLKIARVFRSREQTDE
jgi:hypothetical protein